ncbi:hypothetical protein QVD17_38103 [Tagetes erecta]|uniref:Replication factor A C-terminal domain-containing protein n=1 Tax=Tagetes erecta TaxID=13708 RepID=A0AAD8JX60_TARER|nr:hypothetical protein QVD17_38103 [Tagetes erecta]
MARTNASMTGHGVGTVSAANVEIGVDGNVGDLVSPDYVDLGECTYVCEFCGAYFWREERLKSALVIAMEDDEIASLKEGSPSIPLNVRVLRKWKPAFRANETCYLLIDKNGDAIQAVVTDIEQRYVDSRLTLGLCYTLQNYGCKKVDSYSNILTHCTHLSIGHSSTFTPIPDTEDIPRYYFDIASRNRMLSACDKQDEVIEVCSNLTRYNRPAINSASEPRIIAATSVKVKKYIKPDVTIHELITRPANEINGKHFIVTRYIAHLPNQQWGRIACMDCNKDAIASGPNWYCSRHGSKESARYIYRLNGVIKDESGTMNATIYDEVVTELIGDTCKSLVDNNPGIDMNNNHPILETIVRKVARLRVQPTKIEHTGNIKCTVHNMFPIEDHPLTVTPTTPATPQQQPTSSKQITQGSTKRYLQFDDRSEASQKQRQVETAMDAADKIGGTFLGTKGKAVATTPNNQQLMKAQRLTKAKGITIHEPTEHAPAPQ